MASVSYVYFHLVGLGKFGTLDRLLSNLFNINLFYVIQRNMKSAEELQQKLYYLLEQLQEMARKLPL